MKEDYLNIGVLTFSGIFIFALGFFYYLFQESLKVLLQKEIKKFEQEFNVKLEQFKAKEIQLNLEASQYLQIVTVQRIKWLDQIRDDLSTIISSYRILYYHTDIIKNFTQVYIKSMIGDQEKAAEAFHKNTKFLDTYSDSAKSKEATLGVLLGQITKFKLRLNPKEDSLIIANLEAIEQMVLQGADRTEIDQTIKSITLQCQAMLKAEWEKVKSEVKYGDKVRAESSTNLA